MKKKRLAVFFMLFGGITLLVNGANKAIGSAIDALVFTIKTISIRTLLTERSKLEITLNNTLLNGSKKDGVITQFIAKLSYQGVEFTEILETLKVQIPAGQETNFEVKIFLDITGRNVTAIIRNTWRTSNFTGSVLVKGMMKTTFGDIEFNEIVDIV